MPIKTRPYRHSVFWVVTLLILCTFFCLFAIQVRKNPLRLDEVDYFQSMENVLRLGIPIYYAGEVRLDSTHLIHLFTRRLGNQDFVFYRFKPETGILKETFFALVGGTSRYTYGMWHPPLYIYLGSLALRFMPLTPENSHLLRYLNLVFSIGVFAGMLFLSREIYPSFHRQVFLLALLLYTLNPLAVRGSVLIDYNAALGPATAIWFIIAYLYGIRRNSWWGLIISTIVLLFTSLGIAANLLLAAGLYSLLALLMNHYQRLGRATGAITIGLVCFIVLFYAFCHLFRLPFSQPFLHNINIVQAQSAPRVLSFQQPLVVLEYIKWYTDEIGLPIIATFVFLVLRSVKVRNTPHYFLLPVAIVTGLALHASVQADAYGFPKYILFLLPLLFVYIAGEGLTLFFATSKPWRAIISAIALFLVITCVVNSLYWIQYPGGTLYDKGQEGIITIARVLKTATIPSEVVLGPKDIGFFANRKFIQLSGAYLTEVNLVESRIKEANVRFVVAPRYLLNAPTRMGEFLREEFLLEHEIGSFVLLRKR